MKHPLSLPLPCRGRWTALLIVGGRLLLVCSLFSRPLLAADVPLITSVRTEIKDGILMASATLCCSFSAQTLRDLHQGIPKDLYYYFALKRKQKNWIDEEVLSKTVRRVVRFNTLTRQYGVTEHLETAQQEAAWDDLASMQHAIMHVDQIALAPIDILQRGKRHYISVKAQMQATKLPAYLEYMLFFIPFLEIDTPWKDAPSFKP